MTEFEINKAVAKKLGLKFKCSKSLGYITVLGTIFDPCNNVEQAWDIMMKYNIGVIKNYYDDTWISVSFVGQVEHKKPLVSAMLCFLEMDK